MAQGLSPVREWLLHRILMAVDNLLSPRNSDSCLNKMSNDNLSNLIQCEKEVEIETTQEEKKSLESIKETANEEDDKQFGLRNVTGRERSLVVDSVTLLGGNEYLVQQMIDRLLDQPYTPREQSAIHWATKNLWGEEVSSSPPVETLQPLLDHLTPHHLDRLPRILASSLLFCGRYTDTQVSASVADPCKQMITVNLNNLAAQGFFISFPIGHTPCGSPCTRLSILYHCDDWDSPQPQGRTVPQPVPLPQPQERTPARKISASLALEKKILSIVNVFAIIPCP